MKFACNPRTNDASSKSMREIYSLNSKSLWLLLDFALVKPKTLRSTLHSIGWTAHSAFDGSSLQQFGEHSPHLVELKGGTDVIAEGLARLFSIDSYSPYVSLIHSSSRLVDLQRLCGYMAQARVDDDLLVHCRFADTRVLPSLLTSLSDPQLARVSLDISEWFWIDHLGEAKSWKSTPDKPANVAIDTAAHLDLNAKQFSAMLDASEADTVFSLLLENMPELVPESALGDFRDRLSHILAAATMLRLTSPNDRWQFTVLSLSCIEDFYKHPDLQATWKAISMQSKTLVDEMKHWSDELWTELQAKQPASTT